MRLNIGFSIGFEVYDVVGVAGGASRSPVGLACVGGAEAKVGHFDGLDQGVGVVFVIVVIIAL
jgi:hypothetical protein